MRIVAIGADPELAGFALVGVHVLPTGSADDARAAWRDLDEDVGLVILSAETASALRDELGDRPSTITAVTS